jgi:hypothetical protein
VRRWLPARGDQKPAWLGYDGELRTSGWGDGTHIKRWADDDDGG